MIKIRRFLWDVCDHCAGFDSVRFVLAARLLHLCGSDYWVIGHDYLFHLNQIKSKFLRG